MKHAWMKDPNWHAAWPKISIDEDGIMVTPDKATVYGDFYPVKQDEDNREIFLWLEEMK